MLVRADDDLTDDLIQLLMLRKMALRAVNQIIGDLERPGPAVDRRELAARLREAIGDPEDWGDYGS